MSVSLPLGVWCLNSPDTVIPAAVLTNPAVDGVTVNQSWAALAPTFSSSPDYTWTYLDTECGRVASAGKGLSIRLGTGHGGVTLPLHGGSNNNGDCPDWMITEVLGAGATLFKSLDNNGNEVSIPTFWDTVF